MDFSRNHSPLITPELLARVAKGDAQAFEQLYDHTSSLLFTLARRILNDRDDAADVLQEAYIEIWRKAAQYDSTRGAPMAWLITLTRSRAIDRLRSLASRSRHMTESITDGINDGMADGVSNQSPTPFEARANRELRTLVGTAFSELPEAQRHALELAFYEGLTHTQIAARLNEPVGTIKTRIKLGMSKLKAALRPCWE